jgi:trimeric autotransporter adhesin
VRLAWEIGSPMQSPIVLRMKTVFAICMAAISICLAAVLGLSTGTLISNPALAAAPGVDAADFAISTTPATQNVAAGRGVTFTITVAPLNGSFFQPVALEANGLPPGATATFSPASVTPGPRKATTTLTIQTVEQGAAAVQGVSAGRSAAPTLAFLLVLPFGLRKRSRLRLSYCTAIVAAAGLLQGCESEGALPLTETVASQAAYTITVTGTSGSTQHSIVTEILVQTGSGLNT